MSEFSRGVVVVVVGYLLGSIPFGLLVARTRGVDIRRHGSGNIGATNVARNLGKSLGLVVLLLDALKGALPVGAARLLGWEQDLDGWLLPLVGCAAICGHCFPVWLKMRGGKGVATALGVMVVADPLVTLACVAGFVVVVAASRIVSVGSLVATALFPLMAWALGRPKALLALGIGSALVVWIQHRENLGRLLEGKENRL